LWLWSRYSSWMVVRLYVLGFSWCSKLFCAVSDLFTFYCQIMRRFLCSLLTLVSVGCVMVLCQLEGTGCCHLQSLGGILLVCTVCWVLRFLLGLMLCLVQWFLPHGFGWASHCLWVCFLLWGGGASVLWPTCLFCQGMGRGGTTCSMAQDHHSLALAPRSRHPGWGRTYSCVWDQSALGVFRS